MSLQLSAAGLDAVLLALDDERRARSFYAAVLRRFGPVRPFSRIIESEVRHIGALERVLRRYGHTPPPDPYADPEHAPRAPESVRDACTSAAVAEIENERLYRERLAPAVAGYPDIAQVFARLASASRERHLPAFRRCAARP